MQAGCEQAWPTGSDGELLAAFARERNERAFTELVRRYSPLVLGTCRRVLGSPQDAEDAGQAVFLTLARQAGRLDGQKPLAGWLHQVAWREALDGRKKARRRQRHEQAAATQQEPPRQPVDAELLACIDQELLALPDDYRLPFLLHHVEGKTKEETARELAVNAGTVSTRLHRARQLLRERLERRGLAMAVAGIAWLVPTREAAAAFTAQTAGLACQQAAVSGFSLVPAFLQGVTKMGVLKFLAACLIVGTGSALTFSHFAGEPAADEDVQPSGVSLVEPGVGSGFAGPFAIELAPDLKKLGLSSAEFPGVAAEVSQSFFVRTEKYTATIELKAGDKDIPATALRYKLTDGAKTLASGTLAEDFKLKAGETRSVSVVLGVNPSGHTFTIEPKK